MSSTVPPAAIPFDGQYIHPNASNSAVEWWWGQAIAEPQGNNPPAAFQFLFYQGNVSWRRLHQTDSDRNSFTGYPVQVDATRDPSLPEYYVTINGFFANGTPFAATIPATSGNVTASGQAVNGTWGGAGSFQGSPDLSTFTVNINSPAVGIQGSLKLTSNGAHHFGCNSTSDAYFSSAIPHGTSLSAAEKLLYTQVGWAITVPGKLFLYLFNRLETDKPADRRSLRCRHDDQRNSTPIHWPWIPRRQLVASASQCSRFIMVLWFCDGGRIRPFLYFCDSNKLDQNPQYGIPQPQRNCLTKPV